MHLFIGVGASATFGPLMADMSQWFVRHRGIAVGMAASGNYIGGALWPPVLQHAMATDGWRHTYLGVGVFCVLATLPFIFALRRRAPAHPIAWMSEAASTSPARNLGVSPNALMVLLCVAGLACCVAMAMPQVHIVAYCGDLGYGAGARRRDAFGDARLRHLEPYRLGSDRGSVGRRGDVADRFGAAGDRAVPLSPVRRSCVAVHHLRAVRAVPRRHRADVCDHRAAVFLTEGSRHPRRYRADGHLVRHGARRLDVGRNL